MLSSLGKDKVMKMEKLLKTQDYVNNALLQKAEDFNEHLDDLVNMAKVKDPEAKPCTTRKDFSTCVTAYGKKLMLSYNDKTGNTKVVEKEVE